MCTRRQQQLLQRKLRERDREAYRVRVLERRIQSRMRSMRLDWKRSDAVFPEWKDKRRQVEFLSSEAYELMQDHDDTDKSYAEWEVDAKHVHTTLQNFLKVLHFRLDEQAGVLNRSELDELLVVLDPDLNHPANLEREAEEAVRKHVEAQAEPVLGVSRPRHSRSSGK